MPNECWQADVTHYRLRQPDGSPGGDVEILSWLDDCSRYLLHVSAHLRVSGPIVLASFRTAVAEHGIPASTLTDNAMVFTTRLSGGKGGRNGFETELRRVHVVQKNSRPNHPTTCGKVERVQQTMKTWLRAQPAQPATISSGPNLGPAGGRAGSTTHDQLHRQQRLGRPPRLRLADPVDKHLRRGGPHFGERDAYRRERRGQLVHEGDIVEAGDRDVIRAAPPQLVEPSERTEREQVVRRDDRSE
jgi:hypothetical protein